MTRGGRYDTKLLRYYTSNTGYRYQIQVSISSIETTPPNGVIFDSHAPLIFNIISIN